MAAASCSSFDGLAGQEQASRLDGMMLNLHLQLCDKIRRDDEILRSGGGVSPDNEEAKTAETPGPTDGLESFVQSVIVQWLREHVNLDNWETIFQKSFRLRPDKEDEDEGEGEDEGPDMYAYADEWPYVYECADEGAYMPDEGAYMLVDERADVYADEEEEEDKQDILPCHPPLCAEGFGTANEEEDNHVSSEHKTAETIISHGTDGVESCLHSVVVPFLRECVNLDNRETTIQDFDLENVLGTNPLYRALLNQIMNNVLTDLSRVRETNPNLSQDDLNVYFLPVCWSSKTRVDFWSDLSDKLLLRADELKKLMLELETTWQLNFGEKRKVKIDDELLSNADELKKLVLEWERTWQPLFGEKRKDKMVDELLSRVDELKKLRLELERTWRQHFGEKRNDKIDELLARADELLARADELKELRLELERTWQLHFGEKRKVKIDEEWINWGPHLCEKWIDKIDEKWIEKNGKKWIDEKIESEEWIDKNIKKWVENVDLKYKPHESDYIIVRGLLRFMPNRRHHSDKFQESHGLRSEKSFYNYFNTLFPCLLMVSYGVADRVCREEPWFKKYRLKGNL